MTQEFPISVYFASVTPDHGAYIVTVMEGDPDVGPGDIVAIAEADTVYEAVHFIQDEGTPMGGCFIRDGEGGWTQPDCISTVEALEATLPA